MLPAVLLAAGASSRMGQPKLLLPFAGQTVIEHILAILTDAGIQEVIVVTGHAAENLRPHLTAPGITEAHNPDPDRGMLSSVRVALENLPEDATAFLLLLGDQPLVSPPTVHALLNAHNDHPEKIIIPVHNQRRGHPIIIPTQFRNEIMNHFDDTGLRGLMRKHPDAIREINDPSAEILQDMDTPEDYQRALEKFRAPKRK